MSNTSNEEQNMKELSKVGLTHVDSFDWIDSVDWKSLAWNPNYKHNYTTDVILAGESSSNYTINDEGSATILRDFVMFVIFGFTFMYFFMYFVYMGYYISLGL